MADRPITYYMPIVTISVALLLSLIIFRRYLVWRRLGPSERSYTHLLWWSGGVMILALLAVAEAYIMWFGLSPGMGKFLFIMGMLGPSTVATGALWLLLSAHAARRWTITLVTVGAVAAIAVIASPLNMEAEDVNLSGGWSLAWQWASWFTPLFMVYALFFLVGGAVIFAWRFYRAFKKFAPGGKTLAVAKFVGYVGLFLVVVPVVFILSMSSAASMITPPYHQLPNVLLLLGPALFFQAILPILVVRWLYRVAKKAIPDARPTLDRFIGCAFIAAGVIYLNITSNVDRLLPTYHLMWLIGIVLIWLGYWFNIRKRPVDEPLPQEA